MPFDRYHYTREEIAKRLIDKGIGICDAAEIAGTLALIAHNCVRNSGFDFKAVLLSAEVLHDIADAYALEEEARRGEPLEVEVETHATAAHSSAPIGVF